MNEHKTETQKREVCSTLVLRRITLSENENRAHHKKHYRHGPTCNRCTNTLSDTLVPATHTGFG
jgi:hypothetical protein